MGRRNARFSRIVKEERRYFGIKDEHPPIIRKSQYQREKQKDRKSKMKLAKYDFDNTCREISRAGDPEKIISQLPVYSNSHSTSDEILQYVYSFLNILLNFFDERNSLHKLSDLYSESAYVTLQVTPYIQRKSFPVLHSTSSNPKGVEDSLSESILLYMAVSFNLLQGCCPLPSWLWALECSEPGNRLSKSQRVELKNITLLQKFNERSFKRIFRRRQFTSLSSIHNPNKSKQMFARNLGEIRQLFSGIPKLISIRDDAAISVDVVDSGPFGIYFRSKILALEPVSIKPNGPGLNVPTPPNARWIQRTIILLPPPADKICQEDICILPVSEAAQQKYSEVIRRAIDDLRNADLKSQSSPTCVNQAFLPVPSSCTDSDLDAKIADLSLSSGMNRAFSRQCLLECGWDSDLALEAFQHARAAGILPDMVFLE